VELPAQQDLDDMAELVGGHGVTFNTLGPEARIQVIQLVNQCDAVAELNSIRVGIDNLDHELTKVGDWFKNSRLYEGSY